MGKWNEKIHLFWCKEYVKSMHNLSTLCTSYEFFEEIHECPRNPQAQMFLPLRKCMWKYRELLHHIHYLIIHPIHKKGKWHMWAKMWWNGGLCASLVCMLDGSVTMESNEVASHQVKKLSRSFYSFPKNCNEELTCKAVFIASLSTTASKWRHPNIYWEKNG